MRLVCPKGWKVIDSCEGVGAYCGHTQKQHHGGKGACTVSRGEWLCWCKRFRRADINRQNQKALLRIAKEGRDGLLALVDIVDAKTRTKLRRMLRELKGETDRLEARIRDGRERRHVR